MARNPYNGFTAAERTLAGNWYRTRLRQGIGPQHTTCQVCLRQGGTVKGHSEDYSKPYGPHIGEHSVCYPCHMAVHARFKYPGPFKRYATQMRDGAQHPDTNNYSNWIAVFLARNYTPPIVNPPRDTTWLDTLPLDEADAIRKYHPDVEAFTTDALF